MTVTVTLTTLGCKLKKFLPQINADLLLKFYFKSSSSPVYVIKLGLK